MDALLSLLPPGGTLVTSSWTNFSAASQRTRRKNPAEVAATAVSPWDAKKAQAVETPLLAWLLLSILAHQAAFPPVFA
jgi:hypothetical protein